MQQWDYLVLNILRSYGMNYRANNEKIGDWKDLPLHEVFIRLGKQGYELVAYDGENYIFKRPVAVQAPKPQPPLKPMPPKPSE